MFNNSFDMSATRSSRSNRPSTALPRTWHMRASLRDDADMADASHHSDSLRHQPSPGQFAQSRPQTPSAASRRANAAVSHSGGGQDRTDAARPIQSVEVDVPAQCAASHDVPAQSLQALAASLDGPPLAGILPSLGQHIMRRRDRRRAYLASIYPNAAFVLSAANADPISENNSLAIRLHPCTESSRVPAATFIHGGIETYRKAYREAEALMLFAPGGPLHELPGATQVQVPELHGLDEHTQEVYTSFVHGQSLRKALWDSDTSSLIRLLPVDSLNGIGLRLGSFLSALHSPQAFAAAAAISRFSSIPHRRTGTMDDALEDLRSRLEQLCDMPQYEADVLLERARAVFRRPIPEGERSVCIGSCGIKNVMVRDRVSQEQLTSIAIDFACNIEAVPTSNTDIALVNWTLANIEGCGPSDDVAELLGQLYVRLISLDEADDATQPLRAGTQTLVESICHTYRIATNADIAKRSLQHQTGFLHDRYDTFRSALIRFGCEVVNESAEMLSREAITQWDACRIGKMGAWYMTRAQDSTVAMLELENWAELLDGNGVVNPLTDLFGYTRAHVSVSERDLSAVNADRGWRYDSPAVLPQSWRPAPQIYAPPVTTEEAEMTDEEDAIYPTCHHSDDSDDSDEEDKGWD